jgi:hypothetical protein
VRRNDDREQQIIEDATKLPISQRIRSQLLQQREDVTGTWQRPLIVRHSNRLNVQPGERIPNS